MSNIEQVITAMYEVSFCLGVSVGLLFAALCAVVAKR